MMDPTVKTSRWDFFVLTGLSCQTLRNDFSPILRQYPQNKSRKGMYPRVHFSFVRVALMMMVITAAIGQPPTNSASKK